MLLSLDPHSLSRMREHWRRIFFEWIERLGYDRNSIAWLKFSPEARIVWVMVYRRHPDHGNFYTGSSGGEAANDEIIQFLTEEQMPGKFFVGEWRRAMIAYRGDQGA